MLSLDEKKNLSKQDMQMTSEELAKKFGMKVHEENGLFVENHYKHVGDGRPASGSIYFYVDAEEKTAFHRIDCDEYWIFNAGATLEVWIIMPDGKLQIRNCGITDDAEPTIYVPKGVIFASRHAKGTNEGTFLTCITVPRFRYEGFELFTQDQILTQYPQLSAFFD